MAELHALPDVSIEEEVEFDLPDVSENMQTEPPLNEHRPTEEFKFPLSIHMKKQKALVPWFQPEQSYVTSSMLIDPEKMSQLDDYLNKNLPNDPLYKGEAIKFVENVLLGRTKETFKQFNTNTVKPASPGFIIGFSF